MGRCWGCCQENCGYTDCSCSCHRGENLKPVPKVILKEVELGPPQDPKSSCPKCHHPMWKHRFSYPEKERKGYRCFERMSYDNNDFCGCTPGAPPEQKFVFYAVADNKGLAQARWYRTYGNQKSSGWVRDFDEAKVRSKRSLAKAKRPALVHLPSSSSSLSPRSTSSTRSNTSKRLQKRDCSARRNAYRSNTRQLSSAQRRGSIERSLGCSPSKGRRNENDDDHEGPSWLRQVH